MNEIDELVPTEALSSFSDVYGTFPQVLASAPGRVNLIGEHTDYNEGFVLPVAIDLRTYALFSKRSDDLFVCRSEAADETFSLPISDLPAHKHKGWSSYVAGVASLLMSNGIPVSGVNCLIRSDIPLGSGLSSSAALELATAFGLLALTDKALPVDVTMRLCQQAEWGWAGVSCGIMDQFISARGISDTALCIDCRTLSFESIPVGTDLRIVVCNTNVPHRLSSSEYNRRLEECGRAVEGLTRPGDSFRTLRDISLEHFSLHQQTLDDTSRRRARHVISESARVLDAADALWYREHKLLGELIRASHRSLRDDYEVSSKELDHMADICNATDGIWGARMVGAGFGGSVLVLSTPDAVPALRARVEAEYPRRTGLKPSVIECRIGDGARALLLT